MSLKYIAVKRLKHEGGWIEPGQPIPDAEKWKTLKALLSQGWVAIATDKSVAVAVPAPTTKAKPKPQPQEAMAKPKKEETKKEEPKAKTKAKTFLRRKKNDEVK